MLTKEEFIEEYWLQRDKLNLPELHDDSLDEFYDAAVKSKGWFKNHIGEDLSCTYEVEVEKQIENEGDLIPYIGTGNPQPFPSRRCNAEAEKYLKKHGGITIEDCREKVLPDGRKVMKIVNRVFTKAEKETNRHWRRPTWFERLQEFKYYLEQYYDTKTDTITFNHEKYDVSIECNPMAFLRLGHYACDQGSCFASNTNNGHARLRLATARNSFVASVPDPDNSERCLARCWGFYNYTRSTWHVSNFYVSGMNKQAFAYLLKIVIDEITEKDHDQIGKSTIATGNGVYSNKDGYVFRYKKSTAKTNSTTIKYPSKLSLGRTCGNDIIVG